MPLPGALDSTDRQNWRWHLPLNRFRDRSGGAENMPSPADRWLAPGDRGKGGKGKGGEGQEGRAGKGGLPHCTRAGFPYSGLGHFVCFASL